MNLAALQQDFRAWLTCEAADAAGRLGAGALPGLLVYQNNYRGQLISCLAATCPCLRRWLGGDAFAAAAAEHIDRVPPSSWTLDAYPEGFAATLDDLYPDDPEVAEIGRLECALAEVFGALDATPVATADLAGVNWDCARIAFVGTLRLLPARTNAAAIVAALMADAAPPQARLEAAAVTIVWRQGIAPRFRNLSPHEAETVEALRRGDAFGTICETLAGRLGESEGILAAGAFLAAWIGDGLIARCG